MLIIVLGAAKSTTYNAHMACRILQGVGTGATESVLPLVITDISFLDERGLLFACYWGMQNLINGVFTITVSFLVADMGWQWFYWLLTILGAFGTLLVIFVLPETRYSRSPMSMNGEVWVTDEFGVTRHISEQDAREQFGATLEGADSSQASVEKTYLQSIRPFSRPAPNGARLAFGALGKMVGSLTSPGVIWAILATSISLGESVCVIKITHV
jgi:MFS family permease